MIFSHKSVDIIFQLFLYLQTFDVTFCIAIKKQNILNGNKHLLDRDLNKNLLSRSFFFIQLSEN